MTYGTMEPSDWQNIITVRPGPVIHVFRNGAEFCNVPLTPTAAVALIGSLAAAINMAEPLPPLNLKQCPDCGGIAWAFHECNPIITEIRRAAE